MKLILISLILWPLNGLYAASILMEKGWNLISIPVERSVSIIELGQACGQPIQPYAWQYHNNFGSESDGFEKTELLKPRIGYFVYTSESCEVALEGPLVKNAAQQLRMGWNYVGSRKLSQSIESLASGCHIYNNKGYGWKGNNVFMTDKSLDGQGFALLVSSPCMFDVLNWDPELPSVLMSDFYRVEVDEKKELFVLKNDNNASPIKRIERTSGTGEVSHGYQSIKYKAPGDVGEDSFVYHTQRGEQAEVKILIVPKNNAPTVLNDEIVDTIRFKKEIFPLDNDSDPDGDRLFISSISRPKFGVIEISKMRNFLIYTPYDQARGSERLTYRVKDRGGKEVSGIITFNVYNKYKSPIKVAASSAFKDYQMRCGKLYRVTGPNTGMCDNVTSNGLTFMAEEARIEFVSARFLTSSSSLPIGIKERDCVPASSCSLKSSIYYSLRLKPGSRLGAKDFQSSFSQYDQVELTFSEKDSDYSEKITLPVHLAFYDYSLSQNLEEWLDPGDLLTSVAPGEFVTIYHSRNVRADRLPEKTSGRWTAREMSWKTDTEYKSFRYVKKGKGSFTLQRRRGWNDYSPKRALSWGRGGSRYEYIFEDNPIIEISGVRTAVKRGNEKYEVLPRSSVNNILLSVFLNEMRKKKRLVLNGTGVTQVAYNLCSGLHRTHAAHGIASSWEDALAVTKSILYELGLKYGIVAEEQLFPDRKWTDDGTSVWRQELRLLTNGRIIEGKYLLDKIAGYQLSMGVATEDTKKVVPYSIQDISQITLNKMSQAVFYEYKVHEKLASDISTGSLNPYRGKYEPAYALQKTRNAFKNQMDKILSTLKARANLDKIQAHNFKNSFPIELPGSYHFNYCSWYRHLDN